MTRTRWTSRHARVQPIARPCLPTNLSVPLARLPITVLPCSPWNASRLIEAAQLAKGYPRVSFSSPPCGDVAVQDSAERLSVHSHLLENGTLRVRVQPVSPTSESTAARGFKQQLVVLRCPTQFPSQLYSLSIALSHLTLLLKILLANKLKFSILAGELAFERRHHGHTEPTKRESWPKPNAADLRYAERKVWPRHR